MRCLSVTTGRADFYLMLPVWEQLSEEPDIELELVLTGAHTARQPALPERLTKVTRHIVGEAMHGRSALQAAQALAAISRDAADLLAARNPDILLVIGDRLETFAVAAASAPLNVPIAHLHGGELSLGAIDDRLRHAITKLSHVHFTACAPAAELISRMGEESWRIFVVGAPGLDALRSAAAIPDAAFMASTGLGVAHDFRLVTVHPETNSAQPAAPLDAVLAALDAQPRQTLFTAPNDDVGGRGFRTRIEEYIKQRPWAVFVDTLGSDGYAAAMRRASVMVGNSSSGIIEAALFGLPVVNVGRRQEGRFRGDNVVDCRSEPTAIVDALNRQMGRRYSPEEVSLYGDGSAAARIAAALRTLPARDELLHKRFSDSPGKFVAPWSSHANLRVVQQ